jgi:hypothetical protein
LRYSMAATSAATASITSTTSSTLNANTAKKLVKLGTRALVFQEGGVIVLKPIAPRHIRNLRGSLKGSGVLKALMERSKRKRELK